MLKSCMQLFFTCFSVFSTIRKRRRRHFLQFLWSTNLPPPLPASSSSGWTGPAPVPALACPSRPRSHPSPGYADYLRLPARAYAHTNTLTTRACVRMSGSRRRWRSGYPQSADTHRLRGPAAVSAGVYPSSPGASRCGRSFC